MKYADLDPKELLQFEDGLIRFAGERVLLFDANTLGILRKELVYMIGLQSTRGVFTRMGFAQGWMTAQRLKEDFPWDSDDEWRRAGGRLHGLKGHVRVEVPPWVEDRPVPFAHSLWRDSYEADQHLRHMGQAEAPVCWTLCGYVSGYLSFANNRRVIALEQQCRGQGDAVCFMEARFEEDWGDEAAEIVPLMETPCLTKGLNNATQALRKVEEKLEEKRAQRRQAALTHGGDIVARSENMLRCLSLAKQVSGVDSSVLLTGESGCGKERLAQLIHGQSTRMKGPFLAVNCGAVTESLLESELFGHKRGSFTGATQDRAGLFEAARGGTLFLDEVGELPPGMQVKLLRVLQERQVRRVGENHARPVDVRLIAATNRDLPEEVAAGRFREDLYYRLKVIHLPIPPLRERKADVLPLARHFLERLGLRLGREKVEGFSPEAADILLRHSWPGNVRELENAVEHALVLAPGSRIQPEDLPTDLRPQTGPVLTRGGTLAEVERAHIEATLAACGGNQTRAAEQLGIGTATLYRKLKAWRAG